MWIYVPWLTSGETRWLFWFVVAIGIFMVWGWKLCERKRS